MISNMKGALVALVAFCGLAVGGAQAAVFDLRGPSMAPPFNLPTGTLASPISITSDGIGVDIFAFDTSDNIASFDRLQCCGVGVAGGTGGNNLSAHEAIEFRFSRRVKGVSIRLLEGGPPVTGRLEVSVDGMPGLTINWILGSPNQVTHSLAGLEGRVFRFDSIAQNSRIAQVIVAPVPIPAMGGAFALLLGAGALMRSRRRRG